MRIDAKTVVGARPWYMPIRRVIGVRIVGWSLYLWVSAWRCISLLILLVCLNWHLRILAIRPVPGGWCGPVPLRSRSGSYCRLPHQVGLEDICICIWNFTCVCAQCLSYAGNYVFSNSSLVVHRWVPTLKQPGRSQ